MGKFNEIQEQTTQSWGGNSFTTTIKNDTVEFDSAKDKFTFTDPVEVPSINVGGTESVPFSAEDKTKLDNLQTPMQIKGRVDSVGDLPTEDVAVGDTYLVGLSGSQTFDEYVCTGFAGSPEAPVWESVGSTQVQADWNQNDSTKADYIKNRICYESTQIFGSAQLDSNASFGSGYYTNDCTPIVAGETYDVTVGSTTNKIKAEDVGGNLILISFSNFNSFGGTFFYNSNGGVPGAPNNEKFGFTGGGDPSIWANATVTISQTEIKKIDTKYIYQADWNQNDESAGDYIKNRICYQLDDDMIGVELDINSNGYISNSDSDHNYWFNPSKPFETGKTYTFIIGDLNVEFVSSGSPDNSNGYGSSSFDSGYVSINWNTNGIGPNNEKAYIYVSANAATYSGESVELRDKSISKIDSKYIDFSSTLQYNNSGVNYSTSSGSLPDDYLNRILKNANQVIVNESSFSSYFNKGEYRLPTSDELTYVFSGRANASKLRGIGSVNNARHYILLPDSAYDGTNYNLPSGITFTATDSYNVMTNRFTVAQMNSLLAIGAVFLPLGGARIGTSYNPGTLYGGYYWTSTNRNATNAYDLAIAYNGTVVVPGNIDKSNGLSVRLIKQDDVNGKISISATTKADFAQSNLQYQPSTGFWRFAPTANEIIAADNTKISRYYDGWIDLFGFGANDKNGVYAYSSSTSTSAYPNSNLTENDFGNNYIMNASSNTGVKIVNKGDTFIYFQNGSTKEDILLDSPTSFLNEFELEYIFKQTLE